MKRLFSVFAASILALSSLFSAAAVQAAGVGDLVRCPDTSAVYYLAEDGNRYVFPNENVYFSWYPDFADVRVISCEDLAAFSIGERVEYQGGMGLLKIPSDPTVYAIESDGVLRPIPDEDSAADLYGEDWTEDVEDINEVFFVDYEVGEELDTGELPEGMVLADESGGLFRVDDAGDAEEVSVVLDTDQENVFEDHATSLEGLEERLARVIEVIQVLTTEIERLNALLAELRLVDVDVEDEADVEDVEEIEDEDGAEHDAQDAIDDAEEEITEAEEDLADDEADGQDITEGETLLASALANFALAEDMFTAGDFTAAEGYADEARHDAMRARGKAVDSIDENDHDDGEAEDQQEDTDDDDSDDEDTDDDATGDESESDDSANEGSSDSDDGD